MGELSKERLRDAIIRAHGMSSGAFVQSDTIMLGRVCRLLEKTIHEDDVMRGFLGYGGPRSDADLLSDAPTLADAKANNDNEDRLPPRP